MGKGKRLESPGPRSISQIPALVWDFLKKHKRISIIAGAVLLALTLSLLAVLKMIGADGPEGNGLPDDPYAFEEYGPPWPGPADGPDLDPDLFNYRNPLTGLPFSNDEALRQRRPIAVMHNNIHQPGGRHHALPMWGIGQADIIYEVMVEGSTSRMLALYQDFALIPKIGAVRSARTYFLELALAYDAVLVHDGQSPDAWREMRAWGMDRIDGYISPTPFRRDNSDRPGVSSEHTLFTSGERLMAPFERIARQTTGEGFHNGLRFGENEVLADGGVADTVTVPFTNSKRTVFTQNEGLYYVEQYNAPFIDGEDGEQVAVTNLLIVQAGISVIPGDTEGRLRADLQSGGSGYYAAGGKYIPIRWERESRTGPFSYFTDSGEPLVMLPGKTYVCIVQLSSTPVFEQATQ
jgi:hypothetical protein